MKINITTDGAIQVRLNSSETKPTGVVDAYSCIDKCVVSTSIEEGSEALETNTGKVYIYDKTSGWGEL